MDAYPPVLPTIAFKDANAAAEETASPSSCRRNCFSFGSSSSARSSNAAIVTAPRRAAGSAGLDAGVVPPVPGGSRRGVAPGSQESL